MNEKHGLSEALLLDSAASLRIADRIVRALGDGESVDPDDPAGMVTLPGVLLRAYMEIVSILESLRRSRSILEKNAMERLQLTHEKLREVSTATEIAATDMLDGLDRALALVDRMDESADAAKDTRSLLRDELFRVISCLQFQDITSQQLNYASTVLEDLEERLNSLVRLIDHSLPEEPRENGHASTPIINATFDPHASTREASTRQALADEIFIRSAS
jgi:chemotaxis regulatin CheY-phosphate phosphatase CheZ